MRKVVNKLSGFLAFLGLICGMPSNSFGLVYFDYDGTINFSWTAPAGEVPDHYNVYQSSDGVTYSLAGSSTSLLYQFAGTNGKSYWLQVEAVDAAGNVGVKSDPSDEVKIVLDLNAPTSSVTSPASGAFLKGAGINITGTASDGAESGVALVEVSTNGGTTWTAATGTTSWSYAWTLPADGSYTIKVRATDVSGKIQTPGAGTVMTVDNTVPGSVITSPLANASLSGTTYTVSGTASDGTGSGLGKVEVSTNGGTTWVSATGTANWSYTWTLPASGNATITSRATDKAGNVEQAMAGVLVAVNADTVPPTGTIAINSGARYTSTTSVNLALSATDSGSGMGTGAQMSFSNDGIIWSAAEAYATTKTWTLNSGNGAQAVYVKYKDVAGNWTSAAITASIIFDSTAPGKPSKPLYSKK